MPIRRKYEGWRLQERHKWEEENRIVLTEISTVSDSEKRLIVSSIRKLLKRFSFPVDVEVEPSDSHLAGLMREILRISSFGGVLDTDSVLAELNKRRKVDASLRAGIVVKVCPSEYKFRDPLAIYGIGEEDGLVLLCTAHDEAVTHELGHMLGISSHCDNPNCVMRYECPSDDFCKDCTAKLRNLWSFT